jgi:hypothetical protein
MSFVAVYEEFNSRIILGLITILRFFIVLELLSFLYKIKEFHSLVFFYY